MRNRYGFALLYIVIGVLYIAIPHILLPVCEYADSAAGGHAAHAPAAGPAHNASAAPSEHGHGHEPASSAQDGEDTGPVSVALSEHGPGHEPASSVRHGENTGQAAQTHMVCFWSAKAELGLGALIIAGGLLLALSHSLERRRGVTLMLAASAFFGAAIPTLLIGVCRPETAPCRAGTLPALLILSGFLLLVSLLNGRSLGKLQKAGAHNQAHK
ncbi:MAG: DUF4418 family protein [Candidatus Adiutrix sp.]|jgi:hypothetical protein|nr:DUF4418 family protein [Candidatus Adiutrix sp.]